MRSSYFRLVRLQSSYRYPMKTKKKKRNREALAPHQAVSESEPSLHRRRLPTPPPSSPATGDWAALPEVALLAIFGRLGHADILLGAELTCASWRRVAVGQPALWRRIDLRSKDDGSKAARSPSPTAWQAMARAAVTRSAGKCEAYAGAVDADFLAYLAASSPSLRSLHVTSFLLPIKEPAEKMIPCFPMLERLVLSHEARRFYLYGLMNPKLRMKLERMVNDLHTPLWKRQSTVG